MYVRILLNFSKGCILQMLKEFQLPLKLYAKTVLYDGMMAITAKVQWHTLLELISGLIIAIVEEQHYKFLVIPV